MATFKATIKKKRSDGFYSVFIRVTQKRASQYILTDKVVSADGIDKHGEITDRFVLEYTSRLISEYYQRLNKVDCSAWKCSEVVEFLKRGDDDFCFSDYARQHIAKMENAGMLRNAKNYKWALLSLERFMNADRIMFSWLTSHLVNRWIESLSGYHRAKEMYPICIRQIFKAAQVELNDYDTGNIRIKTNPWVKVKIPKADTPKKLAITAEECRAFFSYPIPESKMAAPLTELGRDVAMMILCLAGINTVDLFNLRKENYRHGVICYQRAKTKKFRSDSAYIEMRIPGILASLVEKYRDTTDSEYLFNFHKRFNSADSFNANVGSGIKQMCKAMGAAPYSPYTFRHTWGTIAQNDIHATIAEVAFAMNHSAGFNVTKGYLKIDFSPAWELNEKVVDFVFFSDKKSRRNADEEAHFRLSPKYMVEGVAYYSGEIVARLCDIGFNNVDEVIGRLSVMLTEDVPQRAIVMYKITNIDKGVSVVYQRTVDSE